MSVRALTWRGVLMVTGVAGLLWFFSALGGLTWGSSSVGGVELLFKFFRGELTAMEEAIFFQARLPRVVFAGLVGASLAVGEAVFQAVLRNPLADPYILGISGGAALGGTLVLALGSLTVGAVAVGAPVAAFLGALGTLVLLFQVERWAGSGRGATYILLLAGVIVNAFSASLIMFVQSLVSAKQAQEILFYLMGALAVEGVGPAAMGVAAVVILACMVGIFAYARDLNAMALGDEEAAYLGVEVEGVRRVTVGLASLAVAVAVAFSGIIGFVGLVVPHGVRLLVGPDHRVLIPACAFGGAAFLTGADLVARVAFSFLETTLPVGVLTSLIGAPLFLYFLWRSFSGVEGWR